MMDEYGSSRKTAAQNSAGTSALKKEIQNTEGVEPAGITPFQYKDIDRVIELSQKYFPMSRKVSKTYLESRLLDLYFKTDNPLPNLSSLVFKKSSGEITGFLGVTGKRFRFKGEEKIAAHSNHLMATESGRASLVPLRLLQHFLKGPQDFSFADGSVKSTRLIWDRLGGETSVVNSIYYKVPLRPFSFVCRPLKKKFHSFVHPPLDYLSKGMDFVGSRLKLPFTHREKTDLRLVPLEVSMLEKGLKSIHKHFELFPQYDLVELEQLLYLLELEKRYGSLQKYGLMDENNNLLGWFIYYSKKGGVCEVIQAVSLPGYEDGLFKMLSWHAFNEGGIELSGRIMGSQIGSGFTSKSLSMPGRMWTLIHSSDPELKLSIQSGKAFLTRLEGDLWLL